MIYSMRSPEYFKYTFTLLHFTLLYIFGYSLHLHFTLTKAGIVQF